MTQTRIGHGYDVHAFSSGTGFVLGGVAIACDKSIVAHSDGDVLIHALCDALLGALGRGDIGRMFPDNDMRNRDRDSREFLRAINQLINSDAYRLGNADITIIAQAPKMLPYIEPMIQVLTQDLACEQSCINIKATTTEGLGYIGAEHGIAVAAVALLESAR